MGIKFLILLLGFILFFLIVSCENEELVLICNGTDCTWVDSKLMEDSPCTEQRSLLNPDARIFQCGEFRK